MPQEMVLHSWSFGVTLIISSGGGEAKTVRGNGG